MFMKGSIGVKGLFAFDTVERLEEREMLE